MSTKITRDILESYLNCKTKAHLKLTDQKGSKSDYENMLIEMRDEVRLMAIEKILSKNSEEEVARNVPMTTTLLKQGPLYILDATLENDLFCLCFDGLKRVDGPSKLGDFHYVPILFHQSRRFGKEQRLLLEMYSLLLSNLQGTLPSNGIIWHGEDCKASRVRLNLDLRTTERNLRELKDMVKAESSPGLILNNHCQSCEYRQRCHDQAAQEDNLSLLRGMKEKEIRKQNQKGIFTVTNLAYTFRPRRNRSGVKQRNNHHFHALQALAIRDKKTYVIGTAELLDKPAKIYLDIEGLPDEDYVYLDGMIVVENGLETRHSFWADSKDEELGIFEQFVAELSKHDDFQLFSYGGYEGGFLKRMREKMTKKEQVDRISDELVNTLSIIYSHVYFPTYTNALKDIGSYLGCSWSEPKASGIQSIVWRKRWEQSKDDEWKHRLIRYNLEDCVALKGVTEFVSAVVSKQPLAGEMALGQFLISNASDMTSQYSRPDWGTPTFVNNDFHHINKCSYFDYQRDKVYVRSNKSVKKIQAKAKKRPKRIRAKQYIDVEFPTCSECGSTRLAPLSANKYERTIFDLKFTPNGVRRVVNGVRANTYQCQQCGCKGFPEEYKYLKKYGHSLKSWTIFEHVAHRASFKNLEETFRELFRLPVCFRHLNVFKPIMADYYKTTYEGIQKKLAAGALLHADETEVRVKKLGKGYVWVFTNLEEVLYVFKRTRGSGFIEEMFEDFSGVLVSDFYPAYDSIPCPQQKCLIHLIRDLNSVLIKNPFDEELKALTTDFGQLLRRIIATVDRYGLKRRHLGKHEKEVDKFFRVLSTKSLTSEPAQAIQVRMKRNQDRLFTFLKYDGVPWNNNNAEHAVKVFAYYRVIANGKMTEIGLTNYLLLLSIYQTCQYKGISFLKFLLSGEVDLDKYSERPSFPAKAIEIATSRLERSFFDKELR